MQSKAHFWGWVLLFVSFVWGIEFSLVHKSLDTLGPNTFNTLRFGIAVISLSLYFILLRQPLWAKLNKSVLHHGIILGAVLFTGFAAQTIGLQYTTASNAGFITGLNVILVPIIALLWLKQPQQWFVWLGVALAVVGTLLLTGGLSGFGSGELLVLLCALMFAVHIVYTGVYVREVDPLALTQVQLITVTLLSLLAAAYYEQESLLALPEHLISNANTEVGQTLWLALLLGGTVGTSLAYVAQTIGQKYLDAWRVGVIYATEPLFAALGGFWILSETLSSYAWLGAGFIIAGMLIAELMEGDQPEVDDSALA
ncbi:DMT family transporter [Dasania sp. GY-MA-18]|uniref:DMT family transporter n=1 Tax=Dasania phycosphaerae TaxID=2950436 RepID=A0A9J6RMU5_9GAMM|nr:MULTISPECIES: DMT family transporter [Dasania]MCR8923080.1 DMT family transporter [Dasania sp. GY-MA-18]MCZ0865512.1 DMT family transporter [Dasania phycosphaerae]MCZ0869237.1 DMT family transporter [Dasania phycosphaerae]